MDWMNQVWEQIGQYISVPFLLTFILLAYFVKKTFGAWLTKITKKKWKTAYTVLIIATLVAIPYFILTDVGWMKIMFSYAAGTSLHELIFHFIDKKEG